MLNENRVQYSDGETKFEGYYTYRGDENKPCVLVFHDWSGRNEFACDKARKLSDLGFVGFAVDMYGQGKLGKSKEEKTAMIMPLLQDRKKIQKRVLAAFETAKQIKNVDKNRIGAIGFCFGGLCALDLARSGADVKAVVSFHGLFQPHDLPKQKIIAKILALHGYDDPMVKPDQIINFANEMTAAKADWQLNMYGNTMHGFTNPENNDPSFGTVYNQQTTARAWTAMKEFFKETL